MNISLNTLITAKDSDSGDKKVFELRTLDELSLETVLPNAGARETLREAMKWTGMDEPLLISTLLAVCLSRLFVMHKLFHCLHTKSEGRAHLR